MAKFEIGDKVLHEGNEKVVVVYRKDFSNQTIMYKLNTGEQVAEKELVSTVKPKLTRKKKLAQPTKEEIKLQERIKKVKEFEPLFSEGVTDSSEFIQNIQEMSNKNFDKYMETLANQFEENTED